jgi:NAD+ kinase
VRSFAVPRVALVLKETALARGGRAALLARRGDAAARRLMMADALHRATVGAVRRALAARGLRAIEISGQAETAAQRAVLAAADLVVSVGGDGTLLAASHYVVGGAILGVNSAPGDSIGHFCGARARDFAGTLEAILRGARKPRALARLALVLDGRRLAELALNDVLVAHSIPAATTRYLLQVGGRVEEHRSSGIWISTGAGSTAGIRSAGGVVLPTSSRRVQFLVRELLREPGRRYRSSRGFLAPGRALTVVSKMTEGRFWVDGSRTEFRFPFGARLRVSSAAPPLRLYERT